MEENRFYKQAFETIKENDCEVGDTVDAFSKKVNDSGVSPTVTTRPEGFKTAILVVDEPVIIEDFYKNRGNREYANTEKCLRADREGLKVVEPIIYDDFNGRIKADQSAVGCLTTNCGNDAPRNGIKIIEPISEKYSEYSIKKIKDNVISGDIVGTITANAMQSINHTNCHLLPKKNNMTRFRVRKLTEMECFKLMGVKVEDFSKIRRNQSKSSCYHLAGDSIVSTVLMALFGQMLNVDWKEKVNEVVGEIIQDERYTQTNR